VRRQLAVLALLLSAGCGLPLPHGVEEPGPVNAQQPVDGGDIQVLPPGPRDDASADDIVRLFFGAQSDPADRHASAREFLAPELRQRWHDDGPVSVVGSGLQVEPADPAADAFRVSGDLVGSIGADGSYSPGRGRIDVLVRVRKGARGRWVISGVPDGLLLSTADRDRSFRPRNVYFLAPPLGTSAGVHLVPDQVFLPLTSDSADALVRRLVEGPSHQLGDSAQTAFPPGTTVRSVTTSASGLVTVDLSDQVTRVGAEQLRRMSAQLVWTLRGNPGGFSQLRLRSGGHDLAVERGGSRVVLQDRTDWASYDPDGLPADVPLYFVGGARLRVLDPSGASTDAASGSLQVDAGAASPRGGALALLSHYAGGDELRTGPATGPFRLRATGRSLSSPTWGSGERGVFFLAGGRLMLAPPRGPVVAVPVDGLTAYGRLWALRVSRDGVRAALVVGSGPTRRLLVGRLLDHGGLRVVGLRDVAPGLTDVRDLSWDSGTSLVVLGRLSGVLAPVRVVVDGSSVALVSKLGLERTTPLTVAAAPGEPVLVGVVAGRSSEVLFRDSGRLYVPVDGVSGGSPFYPG